MVSRFYFMVALLASPAAAMAPTTVVHGIGQAKDGDSLMVGDVEVRLYGIDAPEMGQSCKRDGESWDCGAAAADALARLVSGRSVMCWSQGLDDYGRTLAKCSANRVDVNEALVARGHAVAFQKYSSDYVSAEARAKAAKLGLWPGEFQRPEEFRRGLASTRGSRPAPSRKRSASSSDWAGRAAANCNIKGNQNRRGQWIYHLPGMPYYNQTRPEEIFCSEADAQRAGYRRAIVR